MLNSIKNALGSVKNAGIAKILKSQLAKAPIPEAQKQMFMKLIDSNPDLLMKIAAEIESEVKNGKNQMLAAQTIMMKYKNEIMQAMKNG